MRVQPKVKLPLLGFFHMDTVGMALVVGGMAFLFSGLIFLIPIRGSAPHRTNLSKTARNGSNNIFARYTDIAGKLTVEGMLPSKEKDRPKAVLIEKWLLSQVT